jgi:hypothetical protein
MFTTYRLETEELNEDFLLSLKKGGNRDPALCRLLQQSLPSSAPTTTSF